MPAERSPGTDRTGSGPRPAPPASAPDVGPRRHRASAQPPRSDGDRSAAAPPGRGARPPRSAGAAPQVDTEAVKRFALDAGLHVVGVASADPLLRARQALEARKAAGLHAGMGFTYKDPERSTSPEVALRGSQSLLVGAIGYPAQAPPRPGDAPHAKVAAYARHDHYDDLRAALIATARHLKSLGFRARAVADDNALVDREAAWAAGLGWFGKNANLLLPRQGSWFVLGAVFTTAPLTIDPGPVADGCGTCTRCLAGCPTGAIVAPGVIDARRCLSWLLQQPGEFPLKHRRALGDRIYGCDDCQEVCPHNGRPGAQAAGERSPTGRTWVDLVDLLAATDEELLERHGRWYIHERDPRWVRRNALVVLGNIADPPDAAVRATLARYRVHPDPMLRSHAAWSWEALGLHDGEDGVGRAPASGAEVEDPE